MTTVRSCTVLVVDDDAAIRDTLFQLLDDDGYTVEMASDGAEALDMLRGAPDARVVLLDLMMPRLNGYKALDAIMAEPELLQRHRYVIMTASASALTEPLLYVMEQLGASSIIKPFNIDDLLEQVARSACDLNR